ncbi:hypothetical protein CEUSTIGMA_g6387.t1 [Chlamydomonas eustigma]|uniref:CW-type domain-containing protein n=1 Tax=Chlamydomonas eustigma TaxID=1157962 RepID=A0A250X7A1_9CHLO|nr:hypothetical protein CEUSTIGMA_g6387.t1 [Chlamydomonas eustigma]|eukprot:GAX78947.1 hypothetical protein CEUSTIGMA_g6387.t1 [Chlamydomonas eustigma]
MGRKKSKKGSDDDDDDDFDDKFSDDMDDILPAPPPPAPAPLVLIEELWAQCDRCQKWRLLPPGTTPPPDNVPWFCTLNPDRMRNSCDAPEQAYNDNGLIEKAAAQPKKGSGGGRGRPKSSGAGGGKAQSAGNKGQPLLSLYDQKHADLKKKNGYGGDAGGYGPSSSIRQQPLAPVPKVFGSLKEELEALMKACNKILENRGIWEDAGLQLPLNSHHDLQIPPWVWSGLHHFAPGLTRAACYALDIFTASEPAAGAAAASGIPGAMHEAARMNERTLRMALMAAAAAALPSAESAAAAAAQVEVARRIAEQEARRTKAKLDAEKQLSQNVMMEAARLNTTNGFPQQPPTILQQLTMQNPMQPTAQIQQQQQQAHGLTLQQPPTALKAFPQGMNQAPPLSMNQAGPTLLTQTPSLNPFSSPPGKDSRQHAMGQQSQGFIQQGSNMYNAVGHQQQAWQGTAVNQYSSSIMTMAQQQQQRLPQAPNQLQMPQLSPQQLSALQQQQQQQRQQQQQFLFTQQQKSVNTGQTALPPEQMMAVLSQAIAKQQHQQVGAPAHQSAPSPFPPAGGMMSNVSMNPFHVPPTSSTSNATAASSTGIPSYYPPAVTGSTPHATVNLTGFSQTPQGDNDQASAMALQMRQMLLQQQQQQQFMQQRK